jgi:hypothetical protein
MKTFRGDIEKFHNKLLKGENFTFSKYADGEWSVIRNFSIDNKEFIFNQSNFVDQEKRNSLIKSFQFNHPNYYVGISCPCCQGLETFKNMMSHSNQKDEKLTWANLWVNSNYGYYVENIVPIYEKRNTVLFCNRAAKIKNLPFLPNHVFFVDNNSWHYNWELIQEAKNLITNNNMRDWLFLFCCGPFGNILAHQLTEHSENNTYLDIGSTLNPWLQSAGFDRHYYLGNNHFSKLTCIWG